MASLLLRTQVASSEIDWTEQVTNTQSLMFLAGPPGQYHMESAIADIAGMNR